MTDHEKQITKLKVEYDDRIKLIMDEHEAKLAAVTEAHEAAIATLKEEHQSEVEVLHQQYDALKAADAEELASEVQQHKEDVEREQAKARHELQAQQDEYE